MDDSPKLSPDRLLELALREAQVKALLSLLETIAKSIGVKEIDGLSVEGFYNDRVRQFLEKAMLAVGDANPPLAAELQKMIDGLKFPDV